MMSTHIIQKAQFDRDLCIGDLLQGIDIGRLGRSLAALLGEDFRLTGTDGSVIAGRAEAAPARRVPLQVELEPVAFLEADADEEALRAAAVIVQLLLRSSVRYHMASDLHLESVHADYEKLQKKHEALLESEARYRELAENLEQRVQEQVRTIQATQRQLYNAEKMASVGQLAAGVAHEINNPIGFVRSNLNSARAYVGRLSGFARVLDGAADAETIRHAWREEELDDVLQDFPELLDDSIGGADRIARIVADLKSFSNVDRAEEEVVDINEVIRSVCNIVGPQIPHTARLELELGELPATRCRPGHLGQVFLNMLLNAAQAVAGRDGGEIRISTACEGGDIVARVSDNGTGIPDAELNRVFEPFYTTREVGSGTGLGLTVSQDIARAHGGSIEAASEPGAGAVFTVQLPVKD